MLIEVRGAAKAFGAVQALRGVSLQLQRGECVGLVGHNGAGKSTLVNILCGAMAPDSGELRIAGRTGAETEGGSIGAGWTVREARRWGLRCVFQELSLCDNLTLAENMRIAQPQAAEWSWRARAGAQLMASLNTIFPGHGLRVDDVVGELPIGKRQLVEVARAFTPGAQPLELMILDEPTSSLDGQASAQLLAYIRKFVAAGKTCVLITHKLREIFAVTDRLVVMRDGQVVQVSDTSKTDRERLVTAMGQDVEATPRQATTRASGAAKTHGSDARVVEVTATAAGGIAMHAARGEVIGLAGLAGHGQTEMLIALQDAALHGTRRQGAMRVDGGTSFVAGDRQTDGVFALWSIARNMTVGWFAQLRQRGLIDAKQEAAQAQQWRDRLGLVTPDMALPIGSLSGGNQQKVLFARALGSSAPVILMDDPMRGVDVGTKRDVYALIKEEARGGRTFVWYTTEFDELHHCDRVYVFNNGRVVGVLAGDDINEERVVALSFEEATA